MRAETGAGAWLWASGSQLCMGTRPTLVPYPSTMRAKASRMTPGSRRCDWATSEVQSR